MRATKAYEVSICFQILCEFSVKSDIFSKTCCQLVHFCCESSWFLVMVSYWMQSIISTLLVFLFKVATSFVGFSYFLWFACSFHIKHVWNWRSLSPVQLLEHFSVQLAGHCHLCLSLLYFCWCVCLAVLEGSLLECRASLVIAPSHLTKQWQEEVETNCPSLKVIVITTKLQHEKVLHNTMVT